MRILTKYKERNMKEEIRKNYEKDLTYLEGELNRLKAENLSLKKENERLGDIVRSKNAKNNELKKKWLYGDVL